MHSSTQSSFVVYEKFVHCIHAQYVAPGSFKTPTTAVLFVAAVGFKRCFDAKEKHRLSHCSSGFSQRRIERCHRTSLSKNFKT